MSAIVFLLIVFMVIVPRLREQERTRSATDAARRAQQQRQREQQAQSRPAQYQYPAYSAPAQRRETDTRTAQAQQRYNYTRETQAHLERVRAEQQGASKPAKKMTPQERKQLWHTIAGVCFTVGAACFGAAAVGSIAEMIQSAVMGYFFSSELAGSVIMTLAALGTGFAARKSFLSKNRLKRYELYKAIIGERKVCPVAEIARSSGRKPKKVLRELQDMVRDGFFPLGFVDEETGCFYADNDAYRAANPERARQQDEALMTRPAPAAQPEHETQPERAAGPLDEEDLRSLRREIAHVENADIREKAAKLSRHAEDIFAWVKLHPECTDDVRRFCRYYLPTAAKLLATYNEVAPHAGESSVAAGIEEEVSRVLDTMVEAFRELMDHLLQNTAVDMRAEISALETVLAQEGLTDNDGMKLTIS